LACEESASIACARVILGIASMAKAVTPFSASALLVSGEVSGAKCPINT
jgi:hypothetical protein